MPELPEVETVVSQIRPLIQGKKLKSLNVIDPKLAFRKPKALIGAKIVSIERLGKQIVISLRPPGSRTEIHLAFHLRMSGRLVFLSKSAAKTEKHLRASLEFSDGLLCFADPRRFGTLVCTSDREKLIPVGIEPLSEALTTKKLDELIAKSTQPTKHWLLRQDRIVGLGNIYASEILFDSAISPTRPIGRLKEPERKALLKSIRKILRRAIKHCGTTFSDFQDAHGLTGSFQKYLAVYGREGEACKKCQSKIIRLVQQQRSTFYCKSCQK